MRAHHACGLAVLLAGALLPPIGEADIAAAPAPAKYTVSPVMRGWVAKTTYLRPDENELPTYYVVVRPEERDPNYTGYIKDVSYYAVGEERPRKSLRYDAAGRLVDEIDNAGDVQDSRPLYPGGKVACYLHWRAGKWLNGFSVSPDGKVRHELKDGRGEIVQHGRRAGTRMHLWYHQGHPYLEKRYRQGKLVETHLNNVVDYLRVNVSSETLFRATRQEVWTKEAGGPVYLQRLNELQAVERRPRADDPKLYAQRRAAFLQSYEKRLKAAGRDWKGLGIEAIRAGEPRGGA
jgi:hypothetical protein